MTGPTMLELADAVEKASGPDRALDVEVFRAIGAPVPFQFASAMVALTYDEASRNYTAPIGDMHVRYEVPAYTGSVDAAMGLFRLGPRQAAGDGPLASDRAAARRARRDAELHLQQPLRPCGIAAPCADGRVAARPSHPQSGERPWLRMWKIDARHFWTPSPPHAVKARSITPRAAGGVAGRKLLPTRRSLVATAKDGVAVSWRVNQRGPM
jgi:hypothetical protein